MKENMCNLHFKPETGKIYCVKPKIYQTSQTRNCHYINAVDMGPIKIDSKKINQRLQNSGKTILLKPNDKIVFQDYLYCCEITTNDPMYMIKFWTVGTADPHEILINIAVWSNKPKDHKIIRHD